MPRLPSPRAVSPRSSLRAASPRAASPRSLRGRSSRALLRAALSAVLLTLALLLPREAPAFERQWHVGAGAGYSVLLKPTGVALHGFAGGAHLTYGVSDTINLLAMADVSVHPAVVDKGVPVDGVILTGGSVGLAYVFDVLQWVPYVGATAGGYYAIGPVDSGPRLALAIPFGLDYQISRSFAVGAAGEYKLLFLSQEGVSQRISAFLRAEYIWGF